MDGNYSVYSQVRDEVLAAMLDVHKPTQEELAQLKGRPKIAYSKRYHNNKPFVLIFPKDVFNVPQLADRKCAHCSVDLLCFL